MEKFEQEKEDDDEAPTDAQIIKRIKKQNIDQLKELSQYKLLLSETEIDNQKYIRKDKELRNTITELKISFDVSSTVNLIVHYRTCNNGLSLELMSTNSSST